MNKKTIWTIVIVVVLVAAGIIILNLPQKPALPPVAVPGEEVAPVVVPEGIPAAPEPEVGEFKEPEAVIPGTSLITSEGKVLAPSGEEAKNEAVRGSEEAPQPSGLLKEEEISDSAIVLTVTGEKGFDPKEFQARPGQVVALALVSGDDLNHGFVFLDLSLDAVSISVGPKERRAITFKAPDKPGMYEFCCSIPSHRDRNECGKMYVAK